MATNPVRNLEDKPQSKERRERQALEHADLGKLLEHSKGVPAALVIGRRVRLCMGEALGLRREDIDHEKGAIHIRRQLGRDRQPTVAKNRRGRNVVLVGELSKAFKVHHLASPHKKPTDYVFAAPGGRGRDHRSTSRAVERCFERAELDGSFHTVRHCVASLLILTLGENPEVASEQPGHANSTVTSTVYVHVIEKAKTHAALRSNMDDQLGVLASSQASS